MIEKTSVNEQETAVIEWETAVNERERRSCQL